MNIKKILFLFLLLIQNSTFATQEIPEVTIWPHNNQINYKKSSLLNSQDQNQIHVISSDQISSSGSQTLSDILNGKNGIQIQSSEPGRTVIDMRGFGDTAARNTLILLNGQPYSNPDMAAPIPDIIPLAEIEQIEIIPGSGSILYGDQAVGGIINIITKTPQVKNNKLSLASGNFSTYQTQLSFGDTKENGFGYRACVSTYTTNNYREHNAERTNNFAIDLNYQDAYFRYYKINQHLELPGKLTWQQVEQNPRLPENNIAYNNQDHDIFQSGLRYNLSPNWFADLDFNTRLMKSAGAYAFGTATNPFNEERQVATLRPKISGIINFKKYSAIPIIGIDLDYGKYKYNSKTYNAKNTQKQGSFYGQLTIPITSKISAIAGSRYGLAVYNLSSSTSNQTKPENKAFITSLELSWQALNNLSLFIRRAENYRFPKTDEVTYTLNNIPLKTQTGVSYETGLNYKIKGFMGSLTAYQLDIKNEILAVPIATSNYFVYNINLDPTRRSGAIVDINLDLTKYLQLNSNYNFINPRFTGGSFTGKEIPFVASNNLRLAAIFKPKDKLQFLLESIYTGKRYQINDVENRAGQLGGFTIYNCAVSYENGHYTLTLRGNNLTNKLYYGYVVASSSGSSFYPSSGINILATLSIKI